MGIQGWVYLIVALTFALYIAMAYWNRVRTTSDFYVAGQGVSVIANGMATAADWMSAASFISMAGLIAFMGYDGSVYLMGWTGGYVLLALLLAPFLRKFGKFTVPDFVGDRYYSHYARLVALVCAIFISFTYVAGQMRGVGLVFSRFLEVDVGVGVAIGMVVVLFYAVLGGMKGITYTQVAQYCVSIFAYLTPAIAISIILTGGFVPQLAIAEILPRLQALSVDLGLSGYTSPFVNLTQLNVLCITVALMVGTAGLPHVIIRFFTVRSVSAARWSAGWALLFIALLYTTAPTVAIFAKYYLLENLVGQPVELVAAIPWVENWARSGLITLPTTGVVGVNDLLSGIDRDIMVLALPEIAQLAPYVIALVAAGGLAAALSTASGLLIVISSAVAHDLYGTILRPGATERNRLLIGRVVIALSVLIAGYFGVNPPGFVAEVVAFAFGLAAATFFPVIVLGIFWKRTTSQGAIAGMLCGLVFTSGFILLNRSVEIFGTQAPLVDSFFGISAQGIGTVGMLLNFAVTAGVTLLTAPPPRHVQELVEDLRRPGALRGPTERGAGEAAA